MKYHIFYSVPIFSESPSMRREWIEMCAAIMYAHSYLVSLHAEGVD